MTTETYQDDHGNYFQFIPSTADGFSYAVLDKRGQTIALTDGEKVESTHPHGTLGNVVAGLIRLAYKEVFKAK